MSATWSGDVYACTVVRKFGAFALSVCRSHADDMSVAGGIGGGIIVFISSGGDDDDTFAISILDRVFHDLTLATTTETHINDISFVVSSKSDRFGNITNRSTTTAWQDLERHDFGFKSNSGHTVIIIGGLGDSARYVSTMSVVVVGVDFIVDKIIAFDKFSLR